MFDRDLIAVLDGSVFAELRSHVSLFKMMHMRLWFGGCASGIIVGLWLSGMMLLLCVFYNHTTIVKFYAWNIGLLSLRKLLNDCCCCIVSDFLFVCFCFSNL